MPSRIALIRHGQTEWSANGRHTSVTDLDLTPEGEEQARTIPAILAGLGIDPARVWSSPRLRAQRTAALAGLTVDEVVDDLAEWAYGAYEGLTKAEIWPTDPGWTPFTAGAPGGESAEDVAARADRVLGRARDALAEGDLVLVCHGHISRSLMARWVELPISAGGVLAMGPAAVSVLATIDGTPAGDPILDHVNLIPFPRPAKKQQPAVSADPQGQTRA